MTTFQKCLLGLLAFGIGAYFYQGIAARKSFMEGCVNLAGPITAPGSGSNGLDLRLMNNHSGKPGTPQREHACELLWKRGSPTD